MAYNPALPADSTKASAAQMRAQFSGLKDLIDAVQSITAAQVDGVATLNPGEAATVSLSVAGGTLHLSFGIPRGADGLQGPPFANAVVDGVSTLNPGENATVGANFDGTNVRFTFGIPRGADGADGADGANGMNGTDGADGAQGPPFANAVIDAVTTLNPGENATVSTSFDGSNVRFTFGIPRGADGTNGMDGTNGSDGADGAPGEVTNAALASAVAGTSNNTNGVTMLGMTVSDPPAQGEMQAIANKVDELIAALRR